LIQWRWAATSFCERSFLDDRWVAARSLARWDGQRWHGLGSGVVGAPLALSGAAANYSSAVASRTPAASQPITLPSGTFRTRSRSSARRARNGLVARDGEQLRARSRRTVPGRLGPGCRSLQRWLAIGSRSRPNWEPRTSSSGYANSGPVCHGRSGEACRSGPRFSIKAPPTSQVTLQIPTREPRMTRMTRMERQVASKPPDRPAIARRFDPLLLRYLGWLLWCKTRPVTDLVVEPAVHGGHRRGSTSSYANDRRREKCGALPGPDPRAGSPRLPWPRRARPAARAGFGVEPARRSRRRESVAESRLRGRQRGPARVLEPGGSRPQFLRWATNGFASPTHRSWSRTRARPSTANGTRTRTDQAPPSSIAWNSSGATPSTARCA